MKIEGVINSIKRQANVYETNLKLSSVLGMKQSQLPQTFIFEPGSENSFEKVTSELSQSGFKLLDVNEYIKVKPEDYDLKIKDAGFADETGKITINDCVMDDIEKRRLIGRIKLNNLENIIDSHTVLVITYNDMLLNGDMFKNEKNNNVYEILRSWLKDGYVFRNKYSDIPLSALIVLETYDKIRDFCYYGLPVDSE